MRNVAWSRTYPRVNLRRSLNAFFSPQTPALPERKSLLFSCPNINLPQPWDVLLFRNRTWRKSVPSRRDDFHVQNYCGRQQIYMHGMKQLRTFSANFAFMEGRGLNFRLRYFPNFWLYVLRIRPHGLFCLGISSVRIASFRWGDLDDR
jgi:hypothetical protein